jgi:hypothetical protein
MHAQLAYISGPAEAFRNVIRTPGPLSRTADAPFFFASGSILAAMNSIFVTRGWAKPGNAALARKIAEKRRGRTRTRRDSNIRQ